MGVQKNLFRFVLFGSYYVSVCFVFFSLCTYSFLNKDIDADLCIFSFFCVLCIYNFTRISKRGLRQSKSIADRWIYRNRKWVKLQIILSLSVCLCYIFAISLRSIIILSILFLLSLIYQQKISLCNYRFSIRQVGLLKLFLISFIWTFFAVVFPMWEMDYDVFDLKNLMYLLKMGFFISSMTLLFDIRDMKIDKDIMTLPIIYGYKRAKALAIIIFLISFSIGLFLYIVLDMYYYLFGLVLAYLSIFMFIIKTSRERKYLYFAFFLESQTIILYFFEYFFVNLRIY